MESKLSQYNFIFQLSENARSILLYNSRTNALLRISGEVSGIVRDVMVKHKGIESLSKALIRELTAGGFLVDQGLDELNVLKVMDRRTRFNTAKYSLTIAPTLACNFNCPYCYQEKQSKTMTAQMAKRLKKFVDHIISDMRPRYLSVSWYGGEPLLVKNLLMELQTYFHQQCIENNVTYKSALVSNGYLLDAKIAKKLSETGNYFVQITLDGTREFHDRRRVLKNGGPTFDRIYENIKVVAQYFDKITLRVNVDKENLNAFDAIVAKLDRDGLIPKVQPYPGQVDALTDVCKHISSRCLSQEEFARFEVEVGKKLIEKGKDFASYPSLGNGCGGICDNAVSVDPEGYLYKCWNDVGVTNKAVGRLGVDSVEFNNNIFKWIGYDLFEFKECRECRFLPLCLADCPYETITKEDVQKRCTSLRYNLEYILKMKYLNEMKKLIRRKKDE